MAPPLTEDLLQTGYLVQPGMLLEGNLISMVFLGEAGLGVPCSPDRLTLPDEHSANSLPLVSVSLCTPLTAADMAPHMKRLSRGQTVEGE